MHNASLNSVYDAVCVKDMSTRSMNYVLHTLKVIKAEFTLKGELKVGQSVDICRC